jgi:hypothetical protein
MIQVELRMSESLIDSLYFKIQWSIKARINLTVLSPVI